MPKCVLRHRVPSCTRNKSGFTFIELVVAILIVGILSTIAIMLLLDYKERGNVATLTSDLSSAYKASVHYYLDHPDSPVTFSILTSYGFRPSRDVNISVADGNAETLRITATHPGARGAYQVDQHGYITQQ